MGWLLRVIFAHWFSRRTHGVLALTWFHLFIRIVKSPWFDGSCTFFKLLNDMTKFFNVGCTGFSSDRDCSSSCSCLRKVFDFV